MHKVVRRGFGRNVRASFALYFLSSKICNSYSDVLFIKERIGEIMFNKLFMTMSYTTFMKWQLLAMLSGGLTVGSWWAMHELAKKYASEDEEARH